MTDDQSGDTLDKMPQTLDVLAHQGTVFSDALISYPLCGPARAALLTGQFAHNSGSTSNETAYTGLDHRNTLAAWLQRAGYHTTLLGKYLNGYQQHAQQVPAGWNDWQALTKNTQYNYQINDNGRLIRYGDRPTDYQSDVLAERAEQNIRERAAAGGNFFMWITPSGPHTEGTVEGPPAAPRHEGMYAGVPLPKSPSYNEADVSDKPSRIRSRPRITTGEEAVITRRYRDRLETLQAIDDLVGRVVRTLDETNLLNNTIIFFISDNGYFEGEHRIPYGKNNFYQEAARFPLLVRGPGFAAGSRIDAPVLNIDVTRTIVAAAGATPQRTLDGQDLRKAVGDPVGARQRAILLERISGSARHAAIYTQRYSYAVYDQERELYDLEADPYQLESRHADPSLGTLRNQLAAKLAQLRTCAGASCQLTFP